MKEPNQSNQPKKDFDNFENIERIFTKRDQDYSGLHIYDVVSVMDTGEHFKVNYTTVSTIPWVYSGEEKDKNQFLPINPICVNLINQSLYQGKEVYIEKNWQNYGKEVLPDSIKMNIVTDLNGYKRRAYSFIKSFINPMMARVHASTIYGFITLNNKFLEKGIVFSEENRSLKYIEIMERADELSEEDTPDGELKSEEIMSDLERYIEYREILDRSNYIWNESEKYINLIEDIQEDDFEFDLESPEDKLTLAKKEVDNLTREFEDKINSLNNLK